MRQEKKIGKILKDGKEEKEEERVGERNRVEEGKRLHLKDCDPGRKRSLWGIDMPTCGTVVKGFLKEGTRINESTIWGRYKQRLWFAIRWNVIFHRMCMGILICLPPCRPRHYHQQHHFGVAKDQKCNLQFALGYRVYKDYIWRKERKKWNEKEVNFGNNKIWREVFTSQLKVCCG